MSLVTPEKIRTLQRKLYRKAKTAPAFRFYVLYDKICREDILRHAYGLARGNAGAPGVDGIALLTTARSSARSWSGGSGPDDIERSARIGPPHRSWGPYTPRSGNLKCRNVAKV